MSTQEIIEKEGYLRKRGGRMHRWTTRYFMLTATKISYKLKQDIATVKGTFDLAPGCLVTEVQEESIGTIKGKKIFVFWLVWPHDKNSKIDEKNGTLVADDSDDEEHNAANASNAAASGAGTIGGSNHVGPASAAPSAMATPKESGDSKPVAPKVLRDIVEREQQFHRKQQQQVEEQLERHEANDRNANFRYSVAAAAAGGVVVGALTAGIGLVPYLAVVGTVAAVGGGGLVAMRFRRPFDSRLIFACDTMHDALAWKTAIEQQVANLDKVFLPPTADPRVISNIIGLSMGGGGWKRRQSVEGMRVVEQDIPSSATKCMKAQLLVRTAPFPAFLVLMDGNFWPKGGNLKVLETIDDHADIVGVEVKNTTKCRACMGLSDTETTITRRLCLSRFWKMDDDGIYLITYNNTTHTDFPCTATSSAAPGKIITNKPVVDAVITVSPRKDHGVYDDDLAEALVSATCQVSTDGWQPGEMDEFLTTFLVQHLLDLQQMLLLSKYVCKYLDISAELKEDLTVHNHNSSKPVLDRSSSTTDIHSKPKLLKTKSASGALFSSRSSRGITTVQPGMDDKDVTGPGNSASVAKLSSGMSSSPPTPSALAAFGTTSTDATDPPSTKKRYIFGGAYVNPGKKEDKDKKKSGSSAAIEPPSSPKSTPNGAPGQGTLRGASKSFRGDSGARSVSPPLSPHLGSPGADVPADVGKDAPSSGRSMFGGRSKSPPTSMATRRRSRSVAVNSEAAALRDQIACKEYEVARLEKQLDKSSSSLLAASAGAQATRMSITTKMSDIDSSILLAEQINELTALKNDYLRLTGAPYEATSDVNKGRRFIRYWRGKDSSNTAATSSNAKADKKDVTALATPPGAVVTGNQTSVSMSTSDRVRSPSITNLKFPAHWSTPCRGLRPDVCVKDLSTVESALPDSLGVVVDPKLLQNVGESFLNSWLPPDVCLIQRRKQSTKANTMVILFCCAMLVISGVVSELAGKIMH